MTRSLPLLLLLLPATLFAQIYGDDMHGRVVQPRIALTTNGAALAWTFRGIRVTMDVTRGPVYPEQQIVLANHGRSPAIASDGENVLVVWSTGDVGRPRRPRLRAALVSRGGIIGAPFDLAECDVSTAPAVRWNGTNYVIAWHDPTERGLRTTMVDRFGNFLGQINDVIDATTSYRVSIATDGDRSLIVTKDSFVVVDETALPLSQSAGGGDDVTWNGSEFVVVLSGAEGVQSVRVSRGGHPLEEPKTLTKDQGHDPRVAWNGRELQLLWFVEGLSPLRPSVRVGRVTEAGTVGNEIWSDRLVFPNNFDLAARTSGQTIVAKGPALLVASVISFDITTLRRRAIAP
jgi:hypothetical protein